MRKLSATSHQARLVMTAWELVSGYRTGLALLTSLGAVALRVQRRVLLVHDPLERRGELRELRGEGGVARAQDACGEQASVPRAADRDRRDRDARGHLHDREQRIHAVEILERHRHADDGERRDRREHAGEVGGPACAGDDDADAARRRILAEGDHALGGAVGRHDVHLVGDAELLERRRGVGHHAPVGVGAHDDGYQWVRH